MTATALDRLIGWVAPTWGVERAAARLALAELGKLEGRAYDAAKVGRRTENWVAGGTSANAEVGGGISAVRNRGRDLVRNNPHAASATRKFAAKVVGTGIVPQPLRTDARRQAASDAWSAFVDNCDPEGQLDFYGLQRQIARTLMESGEVIVRLLPRPASFGLRVPLQIQVLEGDYLDSSKTQDLKDGGAIIQGVEFDQYGRRVAYWLFEGHPGDATGIWRGAGRAVSTRVDAAFVRHIFDPLRPGQARGISMFAPVVLRMRDVGEYDDATIVQRKIASMLMGFRKKAAGPAASPLGTKTDDKSRRVATMSPGTIVDLESGEDIVFTDPPAITDYTAYMTSQLRAVAAGVGVTYEMMTGDLSQTNYSSARVGLIDFWDIVDQFQWLILVPQLCNPVWKMVMQFAALSERSLRGPAPIAKMRMPRRRWVDPVKEVQAEKEAVRSGFKTEDDVIGEQGEDPDEVRETQARINAERDRLGLVSDSDPRRTGGTNPALVAKIVDAA